MQVEAMFVESRICPLGVDTLRPAFAWGFQETSVRSQRQTAYRIIVSSDETKAQHGVGDVWDSGTTLSAKNVHVLYDGDALQSRTRYFWKVQLTDQDGAVTESPVSWWEMGLLHDEDWSARWIGQTDEQRQASEALPLFRHEFTVSKPIASARAYVCGLGHYELRLNGRKIGDGVLEPGWTHYDKACLYGVYDVGAEVKEGVNAVGIMLGNGFYHVKGGRYRKFKGSFGFPKCLVQLEITHTDGTVATIGSDGEWQTAAGPITFSCIYGGEDYDATRLQAGWDQADFPGHGEWEQAAEVCPPAGRLKAQATYPLQVMKTFQPISITEPAPGVYVADFGQNFSGWIKLTVKGLKGAKVTLSPAELLTADGLANQKWTGSPHRYHYTLEGSGEEVWSPRFSYYGFRYVQIEGAAPIESKAALHKGDAASSLLLDVEGQMIYPASPVVGSFSSSNALLNRTHEIINWAILSNMKSIFTDCPHREKLGWLEQVHLMGPSIAYNYDVEALLTKVMEDIRDAQLPSGMVPTTAPEYVVFSEQWRCFRDSVSWGATYVLTAWNLYSFYGNARVMTEHYKPMKAYIDYVTACSEGLIVNHGLGDWYDVGEGDPGFAKNTPVAHTETAMFYHMVDVFVQIAGVVAEEEDVSKYSGLRENIKQAFHEAFFDQEASRYATGSQTSNAMPLALGLVDEPHREAVLSRLIKDIRQHGYHTTAGDVGYRYVLIALALNGHSDIIYEMARKTDHPSYGYQIAHGATALTEAWDGPTVGKSQNHLMLGHLEEWLYQGLGGIHYRYVPAAQTYRVTIQPYMPEDLNHACAELHLRAGKIYVEWKRYREDSLAYNVNIPVNVEANVYIPAASLDHITEGGMALTDTEGVEIVCYTAGYAVLRLSSGQYRFDSLISR